MANSTDIIDPAAEEEARRALHTALRQGNRRDLLRQVQDNPAGLVDLALAMRRRDIAVLGDHEAFVRHLANGDLRQVLRPCKLSLHDGTLYQILAKRKIKAGSESHDRPEGIPYDGSGRWDWIELPSNKAMVTYQGYMRIAETVGAHIIQPRDVVVDGELRTNPYVQRTEGVKGRLGDIVRVVTSIMVIGPAPATGNPVATAYVLDFDPTKDLLHLLAGVADRQPEDCWLQDEDAELKPGWKYVELYQGVGYAFCLRHKEIRRVYKDFINLLQNAVKKAQTVARRNALRSHPAFGGHQAVVIGPDGTTRVPVVGWTVNEAAFDRLDELTTKLARGQSLDEHLDLMEFDPDNVTTIEAEYDPEEHDTSAIEDETPVVEESAATQEPDARAILRQNIAQGMACLPSDYDFEYDGDGDEAALTAALARLNGVLDSLME